jgi:murein DD-endopeptidase MepM/ murein hydrolase activator NlpD
VHLRAGSLRVRVGDVVRGGQQIAECGNSGNSTQPHLHLQVMDSADLSVARGLPLAFRRYREWPRGGRHSAVRDSGIPADAAIVEPLD